MRRFAIALCVVVAAAVACGTASAREIDKTFHETFDAPTGTTLRMDSGDGDVVITPWDKDEIDITVRYHADVTVVGFGTTPEFDVEFKATEGGVHVRGMEPGSNGIFVFNTVKYHEYTYTVSAPSHVLLDIRGDDGDVEVSGWKADIEFRMDDGDLSLSDITNGSTEIYIEDGDVRIEDFESGVSLRGDDGDVTLMRGTGTHTRISLEDGDVRMIQFVGNVEVTVDDGDVSLSSITAEVVDVRGQDGDTDVELVGDGVVHVNISTDDGDVMVEMGEGLSFDYLVTMDDGDVTVNLAGAAEMKDQDSRVSGRVGEGGGLVRVSTQDGDVVLSNSR